MGTAIHDALDANYPNGILTEKFIKDYTVEILNDISANFTSALSEQGMQEGKNYLSLQIAQKLTKDFLSLEKRLINKATAEGKQINIIGKEEELKHLINVDGIDFNLLGKADRVDFEGDVLRIIDYKTGKVDQGEVAFAEYDEIVDNPKKAKAFQLLMYAYLYLKMNPQYLDKNVIAGNFSFKNLKPGLIKVSRKINKKNELLFITANVLDEFEAQLEVILTQINNNDFVQAVDPKACEWCDYKSICKR
jgi:ATP-dependent helicase/DNAse subunit B